MLMFASILPVARKIHAVLGHTVGLLTVLLGLTGSILAFREEIEQRLTPELYRVTAGTPARLADSVEAVRARFPGKPLQRITLPLHSGDPIEVRVKGEGFVYVDPVAARVLGKQKHEETFTGRVMDLHRHLLIGHDGSYITSGAAMGMIALCLGGIVLWLPRKGPQRWRFTLKRQAPPVRTQRELHLMVGLYASVFLVIIAWTGISFTHREAITTFYGWVTGSDYRATEPPAIVPGEAHVPLPTLVALAQREVPSGTLRAVYFPGKPELPLQVSFKQALDPARNGSFQVFLDPYRAKVVSRIDPATAPMAWKLYYPINYALHTGEIGGLPTRVLAACMGLMPATLYGTGLAFWYFKRRARKQAEVARRMRLAAQQVVPAAHEASLGRG